MNTAILNAAALNGPAAAMPTAEPEPPARRPRALLATVAPAAATIDRSRTTVEDY